MPICLRMLFETLFVRGDGNLIKVEGHLVTFYKIKITKYKLIKTQYISGLNCAKYIHGLSECLFVKCDQAHPLLSTMFHLPPSSNQLISVNILLKKLSYRRTFCKL